MTTSQIIEIADKVFRNRDVEAKKETEKRRREDTKRADQTFAMLAVALGRPAGLPTKAPSLLETRPVPQETSTKA